MYIVLVVIDDPKKVDQVLEDLEEGGIKGATIIESTGLHRRQKQHIPMRYLYTSPVSEELENITLFTIVPDKACVEKCRMIIEGVVGDLDSPNTGIFASWQLDVVKGVTHRGEGEEVE